MKRALLIAGGTVGGLGAVLSVTPPQLSSNSLGTIAGASAATLNNQTTSTAAASTTTQSAAPATSAGSNTSASTTTSATSSTAKKAKSKKATKKTSASTNSSTNSNTSTATNNSSTNSATNTPSASPTPVETKSTVSGSFTGDTVNVGYGLVQVKITVSNGRITEATALQAPNGRSQRFSDYALPNLREQTLQAQSANIQGVSGASYTSYGWYKSLISALQKAGMKTGV